MKKLLLIIYLFVEWLTDESILSLIPSKINTRSSGHWKPPTRQEQVLNFAQKLSLNQQPSRRQNFMVGSSLNKDLLLKIYSKLN